MEVLQCFVFYIYSVRECFPGLLTVGIPAKRVFRKSGKGGIDTCRNYCLYVCKFCSSGNRFKAVRMDHVFDTAGRHFQVNLLGINKAYRHADEIIEHTKNREFVLFL